MGTPFYKPMKIQTIVETEYNPSFLIVRAGVRYWEDATVNGVQDTDGDLIPLREGDMWKPTIELETGRIMGWPFGIGAVIHYKVCDAGEYYLESDNGKRLKWKGDYVPNDLLAIGGNGYGDYIILEIMPDGLIKGWKKPELDSDEWKPCQ
jgi:hypothetical protein